MIVQGLAHQPCLKAKLHTHLVGRRGSLWSLPFACCRWACKRGILKVGTSLSWPWVDHYFAYSRSVTSFIRRRCSWIQHSWASSAQTPWVASDWCQSLMRGFRATGSQNRQWRVRPIVQITVMQLHPLTWVCLKHRLDQVFFCKLVQFSIWALKSHKVKSIHFLQPNMHFTSTFKLVRQPSPCATFSGFMRFCPELFCDFDSGKELFLCGVVVRWESKQRGMKFRNKPLRYNILGQKKIPAFHCLNDASLLQTVLLFYPQLIGSLPSPFSLLFLFFFQRF